MSPDGTTAESIPVGQPGARECPQQGCGCGGFVPYATLPPAVSATEREVERKILEAVDAYCTGIRDPSQYGTKFDKVHAERFGVILNAWKAYKEHSQIVQR